MSIRITQPFAFDSQKPNFERDVINSSEFVSQDPLDLSENEETEISNKYDVGHIVWDINTRHHYRVEYSGGVYRLVPVEPLTKSTQEWYDLDNEYIPMLGEIIIFTDYRTDNGVNVPMFKVGDGVHSPSELPFSAASYATTSGTADIAKKVEHQLHIGPHDYDGSAEVTVGLYTGDYSTSTT